MPLDAVDLVDGDQHRLAHPAQPFGQFVVHSGAAGLAVHQKQHHIGHFQGDFGLVHDLAGQSLGGVEIHAAGIDEGGGAAVKLNHGFQPVAGNAGQVVGDGMLASGQAIEQRGLAHVGASDDSHDGGHDLSGLLGEMKRG